jgi:hypothetical protein
MTERLPLHPTILVVEDDRPNRDLKRLAAFTVKTWSRSWSGPVGAVVSCPIPVSDRCDGR